jgi:hypothetical protein
LKRRCHSERSEESLIVSSAVPENHKSEMFRFAQHDRHGVVALQLFNLLSSDLTFVTFFNLVTLIDVLREN